MTEATRAPLAVIEVDDLDAMLEAVMDAGGLIVKPIFSFPGGRRFHFTDRERERAGGDADGVKVATDLAWRTRLWWPLPDASRQIGC